MQSNKTRTFDKSHLKSINLDPLFGSRWIKNADNLDNNKEYVLYATGDADLSGRKYVAVPANKILTNAEKRSLNIF